MRVAQRHRVGVRRELVDVGQDEIGDAHPDPVVLPAGVDVDHADRGLHPVPLAEFPEVFGKPLAAGKRVQEREMRRVHAVFLDLQPVAVPQRRRAGDQSGSPAGRRCRTSGKPAACPAAPCRRTPAPGTRAPGRRRGRGGPSACCRPARPASRGSCRRRRTASRGSSSGCPSRRPGRIRARCRDAGNAAPAGRSRRSGRGTRRGPRPGCAAAAAGRPVPATRMTGCQKRRRYSPHGVPGPTRVSSCVFRRPPAMVIGAVGGSQKRCSFNHVRASLP